MLQMSTRPRVREVISLQSWIDCFLTYLANGTTDVVTKERLAYAVLLVRESLRLRGGGWLEYNKLFCQKVVLNPNTQWNIIYPVLQVTIILSQRSSMAGSFCSLYKDCDHTAAQCTHPIAATAYQAEQLQPDLLADGVTGHVSIQVHV